MSSHKVLHIFGNVYSDDTAAHRRHQNGSTLVKRRLWQLPSDGRPHQSVSIIVGGHERMRTRRRQQPPSVRHHLIREQRRADCAATRRANRFRRRFFVPYNKSPPTLCRT